MTTPVEEKEHVASTYRQLGLEPPKELDTFMKFVQIEPYDYDGQWNTKHYKKIWNHPTFKLVHSKKINVEKIAINFRFMTMDRNRDGKISHKEAESMVTELTDATNSILINFGVVAALVLSLSVPLTLIPFETSNTQEMWEDMFDIDDDIAETICSVGAHIYSISCLLLAFVSMQLLINSIVYYKQLNFWCSTVEAKLEWNKSTASTDLILGAQVAIPILLIALLLSGSAAFVSPIVFIVGCAATIGFAIIQNRLYFWETMHIVNVHKHAHRYYTTALTRPSAEDEFIEKVSELGCRDLLEDGGLHFDILKELDPSLINNFLKDAGIDSPGDRARIILALGTSFRNK